ncbi:MAG: hypothetical protein GY865_16595 [candidate division Zixibacteria bacterium]|nr:hypothetical protein [candidate division Zixibacteria bacterium]
MNKLFKLCVTTICLLVLISCAEKNPPRDEIPLIKNLLGQFEKAVREHNPAGIDSLIIAEAYEQGYHSTKILGDIYGSNNTDGTGDAGDFIKFGGREFSYTKDIGFVKCYIVSDTVDADIQGRPVEIVVIKKYDQWFLKQFDLK